MKIMFTIAMRKREKNGIMFGTALIKNREIALGISEKVSS
jgi:hypothetical protein